MLSGPQPVPVAVSAVVGYVMLLIFTSCIPNGDVAATANDLTALPPELQRKGRFDEIFFIDLPDAEERREIFGIHLRQRHQQPEQFDLEAVTVASEGFSGAEIEQALVAGLYGILAENAEALTTERVLNELRNTVPLSRSRREYVEKFRQYAKGRFLPAR